MAEVTTGPSGGAPIPDGPFETERQALAHPAVHAAYDAAVATPRRGILAEQGHRMLCEALTAAGVTPGAYDHALILWLAGFGPQYCAVFAGLVTRAHQAGLSKPENDSAVATAGRED